MVPRGPAYTLGSRTYSNKQDPQFPGPGQYNQGNPGIAGPSYTIAEKKSHKEMTLTPGPGCYEPTEDKHQGPAFTIPSRVTAERVEESPGPGIDHFSYCLMTRHQARSSRLQHLNSRAGQYAAPARRAGPAYSLSSRPKEKKIDQGPGPTDYNNIPVANAQSPAYSIACKPICGRTSDEPAPGDYGFLERHEYCFQF